MANRQAIKELERLYTILDAGEKGYAVSAVNVNNRGLKVLFKSFARQRAGFKTEILAEMRRLGSERKPKGSLLGAIHRGRINIFSALSISKDDRERIVIKEILIGEKFALLTYKNILKKDLPPETISLISRQWMDILSVNEEVMMMRGDNGKRLVVRVFETESDVDKALLEMKNAGLHPETVRRLPFHEVAEFYDGEGTPLSETTFSGAVVGGFWGGLIGILAGVGLQVARFAFTGTGTDQSIWAYLAIAGILVGQFVGSIFGFTVGVGISGESAYQYDLSVKRGKILLMAMVDAMRAPEAGQIMALVNLTARERV